MLPLWPLLLGAGRLRDRRVDPDDLALHVEQRAAGVARVDRGVGLDGVDVGLVVGLAGRHRAVERADDAGGDRGVEAERRADGDHLVADDDVGGAAQGERVEVGAVDLDDGEVVGRVAPDDRAVDLLAVGEHDGDLAAVGRARHDVVVGDDVALRRRRPSRSRCRSRRRPRPAGSPRSGWRGPRCWRRCRSPGWWRRPRRSAPVRRWCAGGCRGRRGAAEQATEEPGDERDREGDADERAPARARAGRGSARARRVRSAGRVGRATARGRPVRGDGLRRGRRATGVAGVRVASRVRVVTGYGPRRGRRPAPARGWPRAARGVCGISAVCAASPGARRPRPAPRAPVVAPGLVLAGHGVDSARSPRRPTTTVCGQPHLGERHRRSGGAGRGSGGRRRPAGVAVASAGRTPPGTGATVRLQAAAADTPAAAAATTVARSALRWQGGRRGCSRAQRVVAARAPAAGRGRPPARRPSASRRRAQVTGHRRGTGERAAQPAFLGDLVGAGLAGDEVAVPRPLTVQREAAGGVLRQLLTLALHPHGVGHTMPAAGRRMIRPRLLVGAWWWRAAGRGARATRAAGRGRGGCASGPCRA